METGSKSHPFAKICGITRVEDARASVEAGADLIGINHFPGSKRFLNFEKAGEWLRDFEKEILRVAVLVRPTMEEVLRIWETGNYEFIQLHGDESAWFVQELLEKRVPLFYAIRVKSSGQTDKETAEILEMTCNAFLLDKFDDLSYGGTGRIILNEDLIQFLEHSGKKEFILAGGLTPDNVKERMSLFPFIGADTASGVEEYPGVKSSEKIRRFVKETHAAKVIHKGLDLLT